MSDYVLFTDKEAAISCGTNCTREESIKTVK